MSQNFSPHENYRGEELTDRIRQRPRVWMYCRHYINGNWYNKDIRGCSDLLGRMLNLYRGRFTVFAWNRCALALVRA